MSTDLLAIARAIMSPQADASVDASLASENAVTTISPRAMAVLEDTLAKGAVRMLASLGGARARIRADKGSTKPARVYDVRPVPELAFGKYTFELLRYLARTPLGVTNAKPFTYEPGTSGDELVAYLALRLVAGRRFERTLAASPGIAQSPLVALGFARAIARATPAPVTPVFAPLLEAKDGPLLLECLADDLALRWTASAQWKATDILELDVAARVGTYERATLDAFLDALGARKRLDLATFLVEAAEAALLPSLRPEAAAARAIPPVRTGGTLRARTEARQRAGALFHVLPRLARTYETAALVRFIDEDYDVSQALLSAWSSFGREGFARAAAVTRELASIATFTTPAEPDATSHA